MPRAHIGDVERWLQDHDTDYLNQVGPIQNTWYEVFHAEDVRLLTCLIRQHNDETANVDIEVRWTIDGNVYLATVSLAEATNIWIYRGTLPSAAGTTGLDESATWVNAAYYLDKRGLDFKVEMRITSVPGTNQWIRCYCVRETQEIT